MRYLRWAVALLVALYLVLAPSFLVDGLKKDPRGDLFRTEAPDWHGIIELWHVVSFKPYQGSATTFLSERAAAYHKLHPGVHIRVTGLSEEQFFDRIDRGFFPDAYSFASGLLYPERLGRMELTLPALVNPARPAYLGEQLLAVPYFVSGYALTVNMQLLYQSGFTLPEDVTPEFLQTCLNQTGKTSNLFSPEIFAANYGLVGTLATRQDFLGGKTLAGLTDQYTVGAIRRSDRLNLLIEAIPLLEYTDLVQYIGPAKNADEKRCAVLADFALFLLDDENQKRLASIGVMPARRDVADVVYTNDLLTAFYKGYPNALAPDPFLYEQQKDALISDALSALTGDSMRQKAFSERFSVVFGNES